MVGNHPHTYCYRLVRYYCGWKETKVRFSTETIENRTLFVRYGLKLITYLIVGGIVYHSGRSVGIDPGDTVGGADVGVAAEDVGPAVLAAENGTL